MAELVDALDSKSSAARRAGSIPALGTILGKPFYKSFPNFFFKNSILKNIIPFL